MQQSLASASSPWGLKQSIPTYIESICFSLFFYNLCVYIPSTTAQGGSGNFKNRKPMREVICCDAWWQSEPTDGSKGGWSVGLSVYLSIYLSIYLFIYLIYRSICLSICFAPQRRALLEHINFQTCSEPKGVFNVLVSKCASRHSRVACSTSQLPTVLRQ